MVEGGCMEPVFVYFIGTAGSGKSTLASAFATWMSEQNYDSAIVNLDPGAEDLAYEADVDIRDWITLTKVMRDYGLGPNGAQIASADMVAMKIKELSAIVEGLDTDYIIVDTPGQMELFTFRQASKHIIENFNPDGRNALCFLFDPMLCSKPSGFISEVLLSASTQFRFVSPLINLLTKSDTLTEEKLNNILAWSEDPYRLYNDALDENAAMQTQLSLELFKALETVGTYKALTPVSARNGTGLEDIYNLIQQVFMGGEDLEKR
jgi:GTPase SAR1 family protein